MTTFRYFRFVTLKYITDALKHIDRCRIGDKVVVRHLRRLLTRVNTVLGVVASSSGTSTPPLIIDVENEQSSTTDDNDDDNTNDNSSSNDNNDEYEKMSKEERRAAADQLTKQYVDALAERRFDAVSMRNADGQWQHHFASNIAALSSHSAGQRRLARIMDEVCLFVCLILISCRHKLSIVYDIGR
jgi:hypothetical protein